VRAGIVRRQARAIHPVRGRKQWILPAGGRPTLANTADRERHRVRWLVAGDARATVRANRLEERMSFGVERTGRVQDPELSSVVVIGRYFRQRRALPWRPPCSWRTLRGRHRGERDQNAAGHKQVSHGYFLTFGSEATSIAHSPIIGVAVFCHGDSNGRWLRPPRDE